MIDQRYEMYPRLEQGLSHSAATGTPLFPLVVPERTIVEDLSELPLEARFVATRGTAKALSRLSSAVNLEALWANPASAELLNQISRLPNLRAVLLRSLRKLDPAPLAGAARLEHLMLDWLFGPVDLSFLGSLSRLQTVWLANVKRVRLETMPSLPQVIGLELGGGMWSVLELDSLKPVSRLPNLRYLALRSTKVLDGSLRPLHGLTDLREIHVANYYPMQECVALAAALPQARGEVLNPIYMDAHRTDQGMALFPCPKCKEPRLMLTGVRSPLKCPVCNQKQIEQHLAAWDSARTRTAKS